MTILFKFWPVLLAIATGVGGFTGGLMWSQQHQPKIEIPSPPRCPDCNCPPTLGSEFDKIKGKNIHLTLNQKYSVEMDGDSLVMQRIKEAFKEELADFKAKRCK
jgi:hypothetical protein